MKKRVSIIMFLSFLVGIMPASAISIEPTSEFGIIETTLEDGNVVRVYQRNETELMAMSEQTADNYEKTKSLLSDIGIDQVVIDNYSEEELMTFASSQEISVTTAYIKTDVEGNSMNLSKEQMISELEKLDATTETYSIAPPEGGGGAEFIGTDTYMEVRLTVARQSGAKYFFAADATWLTMPLQRRTDALGICAQEIAPEANTCQGWYSYDDTTSFNGKVTKTPYFIFIDSGAIRSSISNGTWEGAGACFDLPQDATPSSYGYKVCNNFKAHFQFYANIRDYSSPKYFNVSANYSHATVSVGVSPSLTISANIGSTMIPSVSGGVGITFAPKYNQENHCVISAHNIHYVP